ncbi:CRISPR-associated endonuclease Cas2 [Cesiribacter andamanensis]|uniref:CRISPR-associated endoribonuclease Cas2 n=1 Tax=Cesiribacter andamanensis AMV16 TaxID=1279009 RepID=M7NAA8_9BACT|nr:CRISPR-associated endonuclease Cas2 [Cesiribacter andamanensis]EMR04136.1 CRISPR-associated endoribonuclease Cas2 [Cesiribacter andamanensis AMV16]
MYVIVVYDVDQKRTGKMLKLCRRYLHWIQNSVLEGELTPMQLKQFKAEAHKLMQDNDSLIVFASRDEKWLEKEVLGAERGSTDTFL